MEKKQIRFADLLAERIVSVISAKYTNKALNPQTLQSIKCDITHLITDLFAKSRYRLSPEAIGWIANQYFKSLTISGTEIGSMIVMNDYDLSLLSFADVQMMRNLWGHLAMFAALDEEYDRRTAS